jgi:hypothetical protein
MFHERSMSSRSDTRAVSLANRTAVSERNARAGRFEKVAAP